VQGDYFFVNTLFKQEQGESFGQGWFTTHQFNRLQKANTAANNKAVLDKPTPENKKFVVSSLSNDVATLIGAYPNPTKGLCLLNFITDKAQNLDIAVYDSKGQVAKTIQSGFFVAGNYALTCDLSGLDKGLYIIKITSKDKSLSYRVILE
jgi:hypothetical protein